MKESEFIQIIEIGLNIIAQDLIDKTTKEKEIENKIKSYINRFQLN